VRSPAVLIRWCGVKHEATICDLPDAFEIPGVLSFLFLTNCYHIELLLVSEIDGGGVMRGFIQLQVIQSFGPF
jgi:hypothetical protein